MKNTLQELIQQSTTLQANPDLQARVIEKLPELSPEKQEALAAVLEKEIEDLQNLEIREKEEKVKIYQESETEIKQAEGTLRKHTLERKENTQEKKDESEIEDILNSL